MLICEFYVDLIGGHLSIMKWHIVTSVMQIKNTVKSVHSVNNFTKMILFDLVVLSLLV